MEFQPTKKIFLKFILTEKISDLQVKLKDVKNPSEDIKNFVFKRKMRLY